MYGPSVALYWDPAIRKNGHYFHHKSDDSMTKYRPVREPGLRGFSPESDSSEASHYPAQSNGETGVSLLPNSNSTSENSIIQSNITTALTKYDGLYGYSNIKDFINHLCDLGDRLIDESNPDRYLDKPIIIMMAPKHSADHLAIVRFVAFIAFTLPTIPVVLAPHDHKSPLTFSSCGVSNVFLPELTEENIAVVEMESKALTRRMMQEYQHQQSLYNGQFASLSVIQGYQDEKSSLSMPSKQFVKFYISALEDRCAKIQINFKELAKVTKPLNGAIQPCQYSQVFQLSEHQISKVQKVIGEWDFHAHDLNSDELLFALYSMLKHGLAIPEVHELHLSDTRLLNFLLVVRDSYRPSNHYHNFRHAVDVVQATFYFLLQLQALPKYPLVTGNTILQDSVITPVEALTILIVAAGHDIGHPGVTNAFLAKSKTPLARAFGNKSVLESFHSAAFEEILKSYWPETQKVPVSRLIATSVLATDMALHFDYMEEVTKCLESPKGKATYEDTVRCRTLICCLLIKCADISNVARRLDISSQWGIVLSKEFAEVEALEIMLGMKNYPSPQDAKPDDSEPCVPSPQQQLDALAKGQLFFINTFARPLFVAVSQLLPELEFVLKIIEENSKAWTLKLPPS